ncbi:MAG: hypothetical protein Q4A00_03985 [Flavobacteriaceae bacterium]|nr:hypothetical protein [Flavobacteriaceae bacterium]
MKCVKGAYYMGFFLGEDFYAQAWGLSFRHAYRRMLKDFARKWHYREMLLKTVFAPKVSNQKIVA